MIKAVFLDIDNTLLSFEEYVKESMKTGFERFGLPPYEEGMFPVFERINNELWRQIEQGTLTLRQLQQIRWNHIFQALGIEGDGIAFEQYFRDCLFESAILEPGAMELLDHLKGRYMLCAASNGPYEQQVNRLRVGGMLPYFSHLFISEKIGVSKPAATFFDACFRELNRDGEETIRPSEVMMIGDSLTSDIAGGIAAGMKTCFYNRKFSIVPEGMAPDYVVNSLEDISNIL